MDKYCDCGDHVERGKPKNMSESRNMSDSRSNVVIDSHSLHTVIKKIDNMLRGVIIISKL